MQANRAEWSRRIEEEISGREDLEDAKKIDDLTRWKRREMAFNDVVGPLIAQAKHKAPQVPPSLLLRSLTRTLTSRARSRARAFPGQAPLFKLCALPCLQGRRQSTLRVFEDMAERSRPEAGAGAAEPSKRRSAVLGASSGSSI